MLSISNIERNDSNFGGASKRKSGRSATKKVAFFALVQRGDIVYTDHFDAKSDALDAMELKHLTLLPIKKILEVAFHDNLRSQHVNLFLKECVWRFKRNI